MVKHKQHSAYGRVRVPGSWARTAKHSLPPRARTYRGQWLGEFGAVWHRTGESRKETILGIEWVLCEIQGASPGRRVNGGLVLGELPYLEVEAMEDVVCCSASTRRPLKGARLLLYRRVILSALATPPPAILDIFSLCFVRLFSFMFRSTPSPRAVSLILARSHLTY